MGQPNKLLTLTAIASSVILTGCIGGGGGGSSGSSGGAAGGGGADIGGVAAKGALKKARVTAYCGSETGARLGDPATTSDGTDGKKPGEYWIRAVGSCDKPVKIVVDSIDGTTMENENGGAPIPVPKDSLKLSSYLPTYSSTSSAHVTPLTDAVAQKAAEQATVTPAVLKIAETAVAAKLGVAPALLTAEPKLAADPKTQDEQDLFDRLKDMMPPQLAAEATPAEQAAALATVTTAITSQTQTVKTIVITDQGYKLDTSSELVKVDTSNSTAIATAKGLFNALKADFLALWNDTKTGFLNTKAKAMDDDFKTIQTTSVNTLEYVTLMLDGADMVAKYDAAPADNKNQYGWGQYSDNYGNFFQRYFYPGLNSSSTYAVCKIYTSGTYATTPTSARCFFEESGNYNPATQTYVAQQQFIKIAAISGQAGKFTWDNHPRTCTTNYSTYPSSTSCVVPTGTTTLTGEIGRSKTTSQLASSISVTIKGKIQPLVVSATSTDLDLAVGGTVTESADGSTGSFSIPTLTGTIASGPAKVSLLSGSQVSASQTATASTGSIKLALRAETTKFRYDGTLEGSSNSTIGTDGAVNSATAGASFTGTLSTLTNGTATAFFEGKIGGKGSMTHNATTGLTTAGVSSGTITGKVTNGTSVYSLDYTSAKDSTGTTHSLTYTNPNAMKITVSGKETGATTDTATITSGTTTVTMKRDSTGTIKSGNTEIGTVNKARATFTDGTYMLIM